MAENTTIFALGALQVTPYGLMLGGGALAAILLTILLGKKKYGMDAMLRLCMWVIPCAMVVSHLVFSLAKIDSLLTDYQHGAALIAMPWMGGYTMYGTVAGAVLGAYLSDRKHFARMADAAVPGAMLMLCVARAAEYFTGEGIGQYLEDEALCHFPIGICIYADEYWTEWRMPVFVWEAMVALLLLVLAVLLLRKGIAEGKTACIVLALMSASQIILESLRMDDAIRFGFVRLNQLLAAVALFAVMLILIRQRGDNTASIVRRCVLFALGVGGVVAVEFGLDKSSIDNLLLYGAMAVMLVILCIAVLGERGKKKS